MGKVIIISIQTSKKIPKPTDGVGLTHLQAGLPLTDTQTDFMPVSLLNLAGHLAIGYSQMQLLSPRLYMY